MGLLDGTPVLPSLTYSGLMGGAGSGLFGAAGTGAGMGASMGSMAPMMGLGALGGPIGLGLMAASIAAPMAAGALSKPKSEVQPIGGPAPISVGQTGQINPAVLQGMYGAQPRFRSLLGQYLR